MIGRFAKLGVYQELFRSRDFCIAFSAGLLALASYIVDYSSLSPWIHEDLFLPITTAIRKLLGSASVGFDSRSPSVYGIVLALFSVAINGLPIIWGAIKGLAERTVNVDELVSLAIIASLIQGEFLAAAVVSFVMTIGGLIEEATSDSARRAIKFLIRISPHTATVVRDDKELLVPIEDLRVGDHILVKPGERVPVDAVIISGVSAVDESIMTGESLPLDKLAGDTILAGTLNYNGVLTAKALKVGSDTTLGQIIKLVSEAELYRPQTVRLIDRYARWFTPVILLCASVAWILTGDLSRAIAVLIVGCPCALILAAPTATVAALGRAAKAGVLVKGGQYLEQAAFTKAVLFDKTGTLTLGEPRVVEIISSEGLTKEDVLSYAASAEQHCTHPLARAIIKAAHYAKVVVSGAENAFHEIGLGVRAMVAGSMIEVGNASACASTMAFSRPLQEYVDRSISLGITPLVVLRDQQPVGLFGVTDKIRPAAGPTIQEFKNLGIDEVAIVSGDHENSARRIALSVNIDKVYANLKPQDKVAIIKTYQLQNLPVMFIGDGINDAPALATSQIGVAMGAAGTDVALETADIALTHDDISRLPWLIRLSRRMLGIIKANIIFGLTFNAMAVLASGMGWLTPIMAAITHNLGSVLVVMASASLAMYPDNVRNSSSKIKPR
ncbi:heavy metal translocating P-type ATPase [Desulfobacca acetoxidans]|uniref:P-type Zn(2+) transporter n=1 Tax=Desulfobacca acetoxidans (strain ATCC 700848 / DSM 11109 / ASRB2) TaxID=880072 RepID=F2NIV4_DESAR|nr:cation-translocating P-type ATPase [Desulfobacca acetoxidans]AEB10648.1 heavy metal translocating P-type ATPase [Desulfobacca acetoxidans DSM 11109]